MEYLFTFESAITLLTLTGLEIVLGIDNLIFIALVTESLPREKRQKARFIGLSLALALRVFMLLGASWVISLTKPLFYIYNFGVSGKSLLLILGGLFLIVKCLIELYNTFAEFSLSHIGESTESAYARTQKYTKAFHIVVLQILLVDFIFSFDSIIVAVGMTNNIPIIVIAVVIAMIVMLLAMHTIADFITNNPSIKIIAIAFIILIGGFLLLAGFGIIIPKTYLYFAMFFSIVTEFVSIKLRIKKERFIEAGGKIIHH